MDDIEIDGKKSSGKSSSKTDDAVSDKSRNVKEKAKSSDVSQSSSAADEKTKPDTSAKATSNERKKKEYMTVVMNAMTALFSSSVRESYLILMCGVCIIHLNYPSSGLFVRFGSLDEWCCFHTCECMCISLPKVYF